MHHMNRWVVVALVVVAVVSTPSPRVAAAQGDVLPFKATESTLPNDSASQCHCREPD